MRFYFMGICGTAMGNAALLIKAQGHEVLGSDTGIYPPMSNVLQDAGIEILEGFNAERLNALAPDQVVIGNAISRGNPEVEWLLNQSQFTYISLPQLFNQSLLPGRSPIVITGTHGKTTTSTIASYLLDQSGASPGWLIGGVPRDLPSGANLGKGASFVIEGDEYDSAFFDKRSKFIHYRPHIAVINNIEFDHADIFRDLADVLRTFQHFTRIIPSGGYLLINGDDANIQSLLPVPWTRVHTVGVGENNDLQIRNFTDAPAGSSFDLYWKNELWGKVEWPLHGLFNARNAALAALASALSREPDSVTDFDLSCLSKFSGIRRRQDVLFESDSCTVIEDFAHHPTAVKGAIEALRATYPDRRLTVCFEPRSNTARTGLFYDAFKDALSGADTVYLGAVHRAESMASGQRLDTQRLAQELLNDHRISSEAFKTNQALGKRLNQYFEYSKLTEVCVFFTNGSFDGIPQLTVTACLERSVK
jgi:UDP-N-acetylmuramate: L-alanyl-gamma-D-glutamyl-meso-diaminopimelate ligase